MAKTDPLDVFKPPDRGESPGLGASRIRTLARAFVEMLGVDHYVGSATDGKYTEDAGGEHTKVTLRQTTKPGSVADKGFVYAKDVSGTTELFYEDEAGNEIQLTTGGAIRLRSSDYTLANNTQLKAMNASGTGTVDIVKVNASDKPQLPDGSQLATSGAPTADAQLANKKYIDDQIVAGIATRALANPFGAWASKTKNTIYHAETDGLVTVNGNSPGYDIDMITDSDPTPETVRISIGGFNGFGGGSMPVRKGDYWTVTVDAAASITVHWMPIGT